MLDSAVEGVEKPDPRLFRLALERVGGEAASAVHVGDLYEVDVVGGRAAGLRAVLVDSDDLYPERTARACARWPSSRCTSRHGRPADAKLRAARMSAERDGFARFVKHFTKGTVLFNEDDPGEEMYIIRSGRVAIRKRIPGQGDVVVAELEKGDFFGEMAVLERIPRTAGAEMLEDGDLIVIGSDVFGDMVKSNPEIAVRMLRKYSLRLRETTKQIEQLKKQQPPAGSQMTTIERAVGAAEEAAAPPAGKATMAEPLAYFVSKSTGNVFPVLKAESLIGRFDSVTGQSPEIDLTHEDTTRNISRRHARLVLRDGEFQLAEEIGTMNGTFVNGQKLTTGVLTPIKDGDELTLCRLGLVFRLTHPNG